MTAALATAVAALGAAFGVAAAHAAAPPIAFVTAATPLSGGGGWLVWSAQTRGGWALMAYHDGRVAQLPVALREQPFDAGVGSDAGGAPVVTFSRCRRVPSVRTVGEQGGPGGALVEPQTGIGCRVRLLELRTGRERALPIPAPRGVSDTTPSMWRGAVTFARHDPAHGDVWQVLTWSAGRPRRLMRLPHGRIPSCPEDPHGCTRPAQGMVAALDRDGAIVTFLWVVRSQGVIGEGAWEVRVDRTDGSAAALAGGGSGHEACPAPMGGPHELEYVWPEPPIAVGPTALFGELYAFSCFQGFAAVLGTHTAARGHAGLGRLEAVALAVARDHGRLYGLVPSSPVAAGGDSPGCEPSAPCAIEQIEMPPIRREARAPFVPFQ